jgi:hypothetical protein
MERSAPAFFRLSGYPHARSGVTGEDGLNREDLAANKLNKSFVAESEWQREYAILSELLQRWSPVLAHDCISPELSRDMPNDCFFDVLKLL